MLFSLSNRLGAPTFSGVGGGVVWGGRWFGSRLWFNSGATSGRFWLADWLAVWLAGWLAGRPAGRLAGCLAGLAGLAGDVGDFVTT